MINPINISYPLLIDGGLSNELEAQGCDLNHQLWSAQLLDKSPNKIIQAHLAYLIAGAKCIITSNYQSSIPGFMDCGYSLDEAEKMILKSVELAEIAINSYTNNMQPNYKPLIAASIGPFGAYLADGSEYHGNYHVSDNQLKEFHLNRINILDDSNADFFACETIPSFQEAKVLGEILKQTKKPAWLSFSCKDEKHLNDGTKIEDCALFFKSHANIFALGINCTAPKHISGLIKSIKNNSRKKVVIYPNSGEAYNAKSKTWMGVSNPESFAKMCEEWLSLGADIIGGCCRIGPSHIKYISDILAKTS